MDAQSKRFVYSPSEIPLIVRSVYRRNKFYGVDQYESKRLKLIFHQHGCRHSFHSLPGHLTGEMYPFRWDRLKQCFQIDLNYKEEIHLNTLEEMRVSQAIFDPE